jgi:hypothetical protein
LVDEAFGLGADKEFWFCDSRLVFGWASLNFCCINKIAKAPHTETTTIPARGNRLVVFFRTAI